MRTVSLPTLEPMPFDGLFGHQTNRPSSAALGRIATDHGDDPLPLVILQQRSRAGPLLFIERGLEAFTLVAMADLRIACGVKGTTEAIRGALTPWANCNSAKARRTTRTC